MFRIFVPICTIVLTGKSNTQILNFLLISVLSVETWQSLYWFKEGFYWLVWKIPVCIFTFVRLDQKRWCTFWVQKLKKKASEKVFMCLCYAEKCHQENHGYIKNNCHFHCYCERHGHFLYVCSCKQHPFIAPRDDRMEQQRTYSITGKN